MTSAHGIPIDDKLAVQTVGPRGLMLIQVCACVNVYPYTCACTLILCNMIV